MPTVRSCAAETQHMHSGEPRDELVIQVWSALAVLTMTTFYEAKTCLAPMFTMSRLRLQYSNSLRTSRLGQSIYLVALRYPEVRSAGNGLGVIACCKRKVLQRAHYIQQTGSA